MKVKKKRTDERNFQVRGKEERKREKEGKIVEKS